MFGRHLGGPHGELPCLGLDHDGANGNGNKLLKGTLDPKGSCPREAPTPHAVEMKAFGCCRAVWGLERSILRWLARRVGLQPGA
jgi:hypothetical protein